MLLLLCPSRRVVRIAEKQLFASDTGTWVTSIKSQSKHLAGVKGAVHNTQRIVKENDFQVLQQFQKGENESLPRPSPVL